ncbi:hypothetical protein PS938_03364 [Pseudomonas fluorescens]|uniref:Uncharacterized protein n=1 Tax=Pseudomonas fluorescens TaxID=294 RepID=A0A5E7UD33_PSEFL|nr:hypothetical protein [Pseudomonas fluorescens]VVQ09023.1 hypothetical protein PS938_03364 [Pseudomonas fluorescens]
MIQNKSEVYVVDGNITIFLGSHAETLKQDILHSSLLAHLVTSSSAALDDRLSPYRKFLGSIFWTTKNSGSQILKKQPTSLLTLIELALQDFLSASQKAQISECLTSIKRLPDQSNATEAILNKLQFNSPNTNNLNTESTINIHPFLTIILENKTIISIQISLNASHPVNISFLDEHLDKEDILSDLKISKWTAYLEQEKYNSIRKTVIDKLGSKIKTDLIQVEVTQR